MRLPKILLNRIKQFSLSAGYRPQIPIQAHYEPWVGDRRQTTQQILEFFPSRLVTDLRLPARSKCKQRAGKIREYLATEYKGFSLSAGYRPQILIQAHYEPWMSDRRQTTQQILEFFPSRLVTDLRYPPKHIMSLGWEIGDKPPTIFP